MPPHTPAHPTKHINCRKNIKHNKNQENKANRKYSLRLCLLLCHSTAMYTISSMFAPSGGTTQRRTNKPKRTIDNYFSHLYRASGPRREMWPFQKRCTFALRAGNETSLRCRAKSALFARKKTCDGCVQQWTPVLLCTKGRASYFARATKQDSPHLSTSGVRSTSIRKLRASSRLER